MAQARTLAFQALRPDQAETLTAVVRRIVPHKQPALQEAAELTALAIDAQAAADLAFLSLLRDGLADLDQRAESGRRKRFRELAAGEQDEILKEVEETLFFQRLINATVTDFYNRHVVWETLGYPGLEADGGYRDKGFDKLEW